MSELSRFIFEENNKLLRLVIDHPYFEDYSFTREYDEKESITHRGIAYDAYATMVFNFLSEAVDRGRYVGVGPQVIQEYIDFNEYVFMHKNWWEMNKQFYSQEFAKCIDGIITLDCDFPWMHV